jgi:enoyl-CoA hydratase/carnithine racemase
VLSAPNYLDVAVDDGIAHVVLDHPPVNAVNQEMYREIQGLFSEIARRDGVQAVVLSGRGKHFCGGNDLVEFMSLDSRNSPGRMLEVRRAFWAIYDCPIPVIAAVHGAALGTGLALAASCDFIIAADDARIGVPEVSVGVMGGAKHLRRLVPEPILRWMFLSGEPAPIDLLLRLGAVLDVVPRDELIGEAMQRARRIIRHSGVAVRIGKRTLNVIEGMDLKPGYEVEQTSTGLLADFPDSRASRQAVAERTEAAHVNAPDDLRRATDVELGG